MLQLLSPAGSSEAVIAAVQSGADMIYMGYGAGGAGRNEADFSRDDLTQCLRYCRVRGCRAVVTLGELMTDDSIENAVERAVFAARQGADALLLQDIGLASVLRQVLPDMPLWGGMRMDIHSLDGALAAAAMGISRIMLAPELSFEQIAVIADKTPADIAVCVHGPLCFSHAGQCFISAMGDGQKSDSVLRCAEPCRRRMSLGGRMDDYPMSMADVCLIDHLEELEQAGVSCAVIGGRGRTPEYIAYVTGLYARAIRDRAVPTREERERLSELFAPYGLTDGYFTGFTGPQMIGAPKKPEPGAERALAEIRRGYMNGERRRVPVTFYAVLQQGAPARFAAEDTRGHRAVYEGYAPADLGRLGITAAHVESVLYRTGGTPYNCTDIKCAIDPHLDYADEELEAARRALLGQITDQCRDPEPILVCPGPEPPAGRSRTEPPELIIQIARPEQLTRELAETRPDRVYVPAEALAAGEPILDLFRQNGAVITAVLPQIVTDEEKPVLLELLATLKGMGVTEALVGNLGLIPAVVAAGMVPRGDFGLNLTNSRAVERLTHTGLASVTASFQLSARQIKKLAAVTDTEMIVYGRVPVMITEHCLIRNSSGRCSCTTPTSMSDAFGNVFPVEKGFGCRNVVYDGKKIFLADKPEIYQNAGLWAARLMFTTESARECADVAKRYRGLNSYQPNNTGRGLYAKGAL